MSEHWWLNVALEGIAGAIVGGLVAVGVLLAGFAWQQRQERERAFVEECTRLLHVTRQMHQYLLYKDPAFIENWLVWESDVGTLTWRVETSEPCFAAIIMAAKNEAMTASGGMATPGVPRTLEVSNIQRALAEFQNVGNALQRRIAQPKHFKRMTKAECDRILEALRDQSRNVVSSM